VPLESEKENRCVWGKSKGEKLPCGEYGGVAGSDGKGSKEGWWRQRRKAWRTGDRRKNTFGKRSNEASGRGREGGGNLRDLLRTEGGLPRWYPSVVSSQRKEEKRGQTTKSRKAKEGFNHWSVV